MTPLHVKGYNNFVNTSPDRWKRRIFIIAGSICIGIGGVGIIVPVLPTTPFLLLAAFCYIRGSQRLYNKLMYNRLFGSYLRNYLQGRGMSIKMKIWTLCLLWITIVLTATLVTDSIIIRAILAVVLLGVTIHILLIKTLKQDKQINPGD